MYLKQDTIVDLCAMITVSYLLDQFPLENVYPNNGEDRPSVPLLQWDEDIEDAELDEDELEVLVAMRDWFRRTLRVSFEEPFRNA